METSMTKDNNFAPCWKSFQKRGPEIQRKSVTNQKGKSKQANSQEAGGMGGDYEILHGNVLC